MRRWKIGDFVCLDDPELGRFAHGIVANVFDRDGTQIVKVCNAKMGDGVEFVEWYGASSLSRCTEEEYLEHCNDEEFE